MFVVKGKKGMRYEIYVNVDKVPSSGKYRVQGSIFEIFPKSKFRPKGYSQNIGKQQLTFNKRKDADEFAKQLRKTYRERAKKR